MKYSTSATAPRWGAFYSALHELPCSVQVTIGLYHVLGKMLKREHFLSVTTVGYSAVIFGCVLLLALCGVENQPVVLHLTQRQKVTSCCSAKSYALLDVYSFCP